MGRVRRYKTIKACDPFSKKRKSDVDVVQERQKIRTGKNREKRALFKAWKPIGASEVTEAITDGAQRPQQAAKAPHFEPIKEGESLKSYSQRIRKQTRELIREKVGRMTKSAIRRKEKMKEIKAKAKAKKQKLRESQQEGQDNGEVYHATRVDAEEGKTTDFPSQEYIAFGERVTEPPDLKQFVLKMQNMARKGVFKQR